jgi:hypothetical protein
MAVGFDIFTNLPPQQVSRIAVEIFALWVDFALGRASIGGKKLIYPTGRYAASISYHFTGESSVAFVATAPEAGILEHGHPSIDLKQKLRPGHYLMHRPPGITPGTSLRRIGAGPAPSAQAARGSGIFKRAAMWAEMRQSERSGFATLGPNSPPGSWVIPSMPAYSTAAILAAQARAMAARMG